MYPQVTVLRSVRSSAFRASMSRGKLRNFQILQSVSHGRTPITNTDIIEIFIPIESIDDRIKTLMIVISKKDSSIVSIATSQTLFDKYVNLERALSNNYTLNPSNNSPRVYIKSNKKLTNNTIVDLINTFIDAVDNPILERVS